MFTYPVASVRIAQIGDTRMAVRTVPNTNEPSADSAVSCRVIRKAARI